jgi:hypothetical protein
MGMGPITIFDKSALQALNMDESVWLDAFFLVNVVPVFYVETLADLEKEMGEGRSAEELVGMLARKTPPNAVPNVHHSALLSQELLTGWEVPMDGRVPVAAGDVRRTPDGDVGVHIDEFNEAVALERWQSHEFLEIERHVARRWRTELADDDRDRLRGVLRNILPVGERIADLAALKAVIDRFCDSSEPEVVALALEVVGVPASAARVVSARWEAAGRRPLPAFAPYTTHVFKVDLLYYLGIERGFISGERPSNKADVAYLYYLPFSMVFTSGDNLHRRTAPLFLRADQSFVKGRDLKEALGVLDRHYAELPEEIKALGVMGFAHNPPLDFDNLVTDLWDRHLRPDWRDQARSPEEILERRQASASSESETVAEMRERIEGAELVADDVAPPGAEPDYFVIRRRVPVQKGKWRLLPDGIEEDESE